MEKRVSSTCPLGLPPLPLGPAPSSSSSSSSCHASPVEWVESITLRSVVVLKIDTPLLRRVTLVDPMVS